MQGDNNDWVDPFSTDATTRSSGIATLHLPKVGLGRALLTSPLLWLSLLVIALAIFVWPSSADIETGDDESDLLRGPDPAADVSASSVGAMS